MVDPRIIANFVLDRADERGKQITNLDLQKIVYFLHGHYLCRYNQPLVDSEFEAWTYGPVHKLIYDAFKVYNDSPIEGRAIAFNPVTRQNRELPELSDARIISIIDENLDQYLNMTTYSLVQLTHRDGTPWSQTVNDADNRVNIGMRIPNNLIRECFEGSLTPRE
jgi:uncharacterized phage-associated protein